VKLLFDKARPSFPFFYEANGGRAYSGNNRKRVAWYSLSKGSSDMDHLTLGQLMRWRFFPSKVDKTSLPLVSSVFLQSNPLKILRSIVQFVAIDVVNGKSIRMAINKSHRHKSMHKNFWALWTKFRRNNLIATFRRPWFYFNLLSTACKNLRLAVLHSLSRRCDGRSEDASIFADKPINSFFVDKYGFHAVNCIAGH